MAGILKVYRVLNVLSLDVAVGAMLLSFGVQRVLQIDVTWISNVCLGLSVWSIYTFDHLIDARRIPHEPSTLRHRFHKNNFRFLRIILFLFIVTGVVLSLNLPTIIFMYGLGFMVLVGIYFALVFNWRSFYIKELIVAVVYASGVFLAPVSMSLSGFPILGWSLYAQLLVIAGINLLLFSLVEFDSDFQDGHNSLALRIGRNRSSSLLRFLYGALIIIQSVTLVLWCETFSEISFQLIFLSMGLVLIIIFKKREQLQVNEAYRMIGDAVFLFPGIYLAFDVIFNT